MKKVIVYTCCLFAMLLSFLLSVSTSVSAVENCDSGFITTTMFDEAASQFLADIDLKLSDTIVENAMISSFDVSPSGMIAIAFNTGSEKAINVIDQNGVYQYGYTFQCDGKYGVDWCGQNLAICFVRYNVVAIFDASGVCISIERIDDTLIDSAAHNNSYWNSYIFADCLEHNNVRYELKGILGTLRFANSKLIATTESGTANVLYDASIYELLAIFLFVAAFSVPIVIVVITIVKHLNTLSTTN